MNVYEFSWILCCLINLKSNFRRDIFVWVWRETAFLWLGQISGLKIRRDSCLSYRRTENVFWSIVSNVWISKHSFYCSYALCSLGEEFVNWIFDWK